MGLDGIYISGYFEEEDYNILDDYANELNSKNIPFYVRNLSGTIMQAAFDFANFELIAISYTVLQQFILNGGYDLTKYFFLKLWRFIKKDHQNKIPFTISIEGIPTINGSENIKCKIDGQISDDIKMKAIEKTFELASQIENNQIQILSKGRDYYTLEGHLFRYDSENNTFSKINIEDEAKKMTQRNSRTTDS